MRWSADAGELAAAAAGRWGEGLPVPTGEVMVVAGDLRRARPAMASGTARPSGSREAVIVAWSAMWAGGPAWWVVAVEGLSGRRLRRAQRAGLPTSAGRATVTRDARGWLHCLMNGASGSSPRATLAVKYRAVRAADSAAGAEQEGRDRAQRAVVVWVDRERRVASRSVGLRVSGRSDAECELHDCHVMAGLGVSFAETPVVASWIDEACLTASS